ncbi:uncharacterized protein LOC133033428 [Cannabis sativa]|uniref:Remorin C-terminal domain-containing protein n=1 Tax=Cannabis sativa TaxID=3483 RepID=A0A7J6I3R9_CANSA|nr:uncharacterized protein LOC133033428 [Cannabis sativa]KAF4401855.1 hypothetical protein G4B88_013142 [Cannabis sativa]
MINRRLSTRTSIQPTQRTEPHIDAPLTSNLCDNGTPSLPRKFTNSRRTIGKSSDWSLNSPKEDQPESPSPICSSCTSPLSSKTSSSKLNTFFSRLSTESATPRNQSYYVDSDSGKNGRFNDPNPQDKYPLAIEENSVAEEISSQACSLGNFGVSNGESPDYLQHNLMTRPKPYSTFLDEVKKQELEAEVEAWKKTKETELIDKLARKEAAINEWEHKKTSKIVEEMKKFESKLEKKRAKALQKFQKKMNIAKAEANKMTTKARKETIEKISDISKISDTALATKNSKCVKLRFS